MKLDRILVVIDMQNDFITGPLGNEQAQEAVGRIVQKVREHEGFVYATMDTHGQNYLQTQEGQKLPVKHCMRGSDGWQLHKSVHLAVNAKPEHTVIEKHTFFATRVVTDLLCKCTATEQEPEVIELCGVCTDICVMCNALLLKAFFPDTTIAVDASCCAGTTPETHQKALDVMRLCQIEIKEAAGNA